MPPATRTDHHLTRHGVLSLSLYLLLEGVGEGGEFLLQEEVLEATLLLDIVDGLGEPAVELISLLLDLGTRTAAGVD